MIDSELEYVHTSTFSVTISRRIVINQRWVLASVIVASSLFLSACNSGSVTSEYSEGSKSSATADEVKPSESPSLPQQIYGIPLKMTCDQLMSPANLYEYNPNFSFDSSSKFVETQTSKQISNLSGVSCVYLNLSSQQQIQLNVAQIKPDSVQALTEQVQNIPGVAIEKTTQGFPTYFYKDSDVGITIQIINDFIISVASEGFQQASDAEEFMTPVINSLR